MSGTLFGVLAILGALLLPIIASASIGLVGGVVLFFYALKNQAGYRVVVSTDGVREFRRKMNSDWAPLRETPCADWTKVRVWSIAGTERLELVQVGSPPEGPPWVHQKRVVPGHGEGIRESILLAEFQGEHLPPEFENAGAEINELLRRHRDGARTNLK